MVALEAVSETWVNGFGFRPIAGMRAGSRGVAIDVPRDIEINGAGLPQEYGCRDKYNR